MPAGTPSVTSLDSGGHVPLTQLGGRAPPIDFAVSYCFGLRLIKVGYSGPLIRLRRASDDAESDFFSIRGFLDTAAITTFLGGSDGFVTTWYDQSGNGRDVIQGTVGRQPAFVEEINGRPSMLYNGTDSALVSTGHDIAQPVEVLWVFQVDDTSSQFFFDSANAAKRCSATVQGATGFLAAFAGGAGAYFASVDVTRTETRYAGVQFNGALSVTRLDGAELATGDPGAENMDGVTVGSRNSIASSLLGHVSEFIISDGLLSGADRTALEADQASFYGVP